PSCARNGDCGFSTQLSNGTCCRKNYPNYKTVQRRFQTWCCNEILLRVLADVANELPNKSALDSSSMRRSSWPRMADPKSEQRAAEKALAILCKRSYCSANHQPPKRQSQNPTKDPGDHLFLTVVRRCSCRPAP